MKNMRVSMCIVIICVLLLGSCHTSSVAAEDRQGGTDEPPVETGLLIDISDVDTMTILWTWVFEGDGAEALRVDMDLDADGKVTSVELSTRLDELNDPLDPVDTEVNITLEGSMPESVGMEFDLDGAEGDVDSDAALTITFTETISFASMDARDTYTYGFLHMEEFIGGDEPWENEFIGGDEPWENEFIGGDEPWENRVDPVFRCSAPEDHVFDTAGWPTGLSDHLVQDGKVIEMQGEAFRTDYNSTFGSLDFLTIAKDVPDIEVVYEKLDVSVDIETADRFVLAMTATFEGASAGAMRALMDTDADGTVSQTEMEAYLDEVNGPFQVVDTDVGVRRDGSAPEGVTMAFSVSGAVGDVDGTVSLGITFTATVTFASGEDKDAHTFDISGAEEFIGGDEPWENEFIGDDPWDNEFIGGDEPWENRVDLAISISCPDGWRFKADDLVSGLEEFVGTNGDTISMQGDQLRSSYNSTVGSQDTLTIEKEGIGGNGDDSPGFSTIAVALAAVCALSIVLRRRRQSD